MILQRVATLFRILIDNQCTIGALWLQFDSIRGQKMTFTFEITLGNDAMKDPADVAESLERVAQTLRDYGFECEASTILDANGNRVGTWALTE